MTPAQQLIDPLALDDCQTCAGFEEMMSAYVTAEESAAGPIVTINESRARGVGEDTVVFLESVETKPETLAKDGTTATSAGESTPFTMVMTVAFQDGMWHVSEIQVQQ